MAARTAAHAYAVQHKTDRKIDSDRFPEWRPFVDAVQKRRPDTGTWCAAWTVREIVIHQAGNAEELLDAFGGALGRGLGTGEQVLAGMLAGEPGQGK